VEFSAYGPLHGGPQFVFGSAGPAQPVGRAVGQSARSVCRSVGLAKTRDDGTGAIVSERHRPGTGFTSPAPVLGGHVR